VVTGQAHCFNSRCGYGSKNCIKALTRQLSLRAVQTEGKAEKKTLEEVEIPKGAFYLGKRPNYSQWSRKAFEYLTQKRSMTKQDIINKRVLFTEVGKLSHRAIFPVAVEDKIVGLVARGILKSQSP